MKNLGLQAALIFVIGCVLLWLDGSGGHWDKATWVSYVGGGVCILGVFWYPVSTLIRAFKE